MKQAQNTHCETAILLIGCQGFDFLLDNRGLLIRRSNVDYKNKLSSQNHYKGEYSTCPIMHQFRDTRVYVGFMTHSGKFITGHTLLKTSM